MALVKESDGRIRYSIRCKYCKTRWIEPLAPGGCMGPNFFPAMAAHSCDKLTERRLMWEKRGRSRQKADIDAVQLQPVKWTWRPEDDRTQCNGKCLGAKGPSCDCKCEGKCHGAGQCVPGAHS